MRTALGDRLGGLLLAAPAPSPDPDRPGCGGLVAVDVSDGMDAPGLAGFRELVNIIAAFTLVGCLAAVLAGLFLATSGRFVDRHASTTGRVMVAVGVLSAFGVGIAAAGVNFAFSTGSDSC